MRSVRPRYGRLHAEVNTNALTANHGERDFRLCDAAQNILNVKDDISGLVTQLVNHKVENTTIQVVVLL